MKGAKHYSRQQATTSQTQHVQIQKKRSTAINACSGLSHPTGQHYPLRTDLGVFSRAEKPSEDLTRCWYLMNMKRLMNFRRLFFHLSEQILFKKMAFFSFQFAFSFFLAYICTILFFGYFCFLLNFDYLCFTERAVSLCSPDRYLSWKIEDYFSPQ